MKMNAHAWVVVITITLGLTGGFGGAALAKAVHASALSYALRCDSQYPRPLKVQEQEAAYCAQYRFLKVWPVELP